MNLRIILTLILAMSYWWLKAAIYNTDIYTLNILSFIFLITTAYAFMLLIYAILHDILNQYLPKIIIAKSTKIIIFTLLFLSILLPLFMNSYQMITGYALALCELIWIFSIIAAFYIMVVKRQPDDFHITISRKSFEEIFLASYFDIISKDELRVVALDTYFDKDQLIAFINEYFTKGGIAKADVDARLSNFPWADYFTKTSSRRPLYYHDIENYFVKYFFVQSVQNFEV